MSAEVKHTLIIGASKGIGKAIADYFQEHDRPTIRAARSLPSKHTGNYYRLDVSNKESVDAFFGKLVEKNMSFDTVIFAAGIGHFEKFENITDTEWNESLNINLTGAFYTLQAAYKRLKMHPTGGRIITIGSISDHLALPSNAAYAASKFGLRGLMAVMHEEGREYGITATNISLGATYTDIWKTRPEFSSNDMLLPEEVAQTIYALSTLPKKVTIPNVTITPPKGVL